MNGLILAGGEGMRMRPYTEDVPKPMLEVAGKPMLHWITEQLGRAGIREVVLMENYLPNVIQDYFEATADLNTEIVHLTDKHPNSGTAGLIKEATNCFSNKHDDVMVMAGDTLLDIDYKDFMEFHVSRKALATVVGRRMKLPHGIFDCDISNRVVSVHEKPSVMIPTATMILKKEVIDSIDERGDFFLNIVPYIERSGHVFEVNPDQVIHVSELRDDLSIANDKWAEVQKSRAL